jgi:threonine dehydrogenase-like Zn-dependent dehydrogenase
MKNNRVLEIRKGEARVVEQPVAEPGAGFVLVRQTIAPNCIEHRIYESGFFEFHEQGPSRRLDDHAWLGDGEYCAHAGHEGVGEIVAVGPGANRWQPGQRVVVFQGWACGECWVCENGLGSTHCINLGLPVDIEQTNGSRSGGNGFCEYRLVPANMLEEIPDGLSDKYASAANCLIGCTYSGIRDLKVEPESVCLVGGVGFIGLATLINLKYRGARVIALGRDPARMEAASSLFEADHIVNPEDPDWLEQVRALTPQGRGVDFAFECSGYPYYQQRCMESLRHYGTLMLFGYAAHEGRDLTWNIHTESALCWGHQVITAHFDVNFNHRKDILRMLCDLWVQGKLDQLITHSFPMSQANEAFELLLNRSESKEFVGKIHLIPGE